MNPANNPDNSELYIDKLVKQRLRPPFRNFFPQLAKLTKTVAPLNTNVLRSLAVSRKNFFR